MNDDTYPSNVIAYAMQRHAQLTTTCHQLRDNGMPLSIGTHDPEQALELYASVLAVTVPPTIIGWFHQHSLGVFQEVRFLGEHSDVPTKPLEALLRRDLWIFERAGEHLPTVSPLQAEALEVGGPNGWREVLAAGVPRYLLTVPGTFLLAWQAQWTDAMRMLHGHYGANVSEPAPAVADSWEERLAVVEEGIGAVRSAIALAGTVLSAPGPDDDLS